MESSPKSRFPAGVDLIRRRECRMGGLTPMACMFCPYGHMTECHYPYTCDEAECSHYLAEMEAEEATYPPDVEEVP